MPSPFCVVRKFTTECIVAVSMQAEANYGRNTVKLVANRQLRVQIDASKNRKVKAISSQTGIGIAEDRDCS